MKLISAQLVIALATSELCYPAKWFSITTRGTETDPCYCVSIDINGKTSEIPRLDDAMDTVANGKYPLSY